MYKYLTRRNQRCTFGFSHNCSDYALDYREWFLLSLTVRAGAEAIVMFKMWDNLAVYLTPWIKRVLLAELNVKINEIGRYSCLSRSRRIRSRERLSGARKSCSKHESSRGRWCPRNEWPRERLSDAQESAMLACLVICFERSWWGGTHVWILVQVKIQPLQKFT